MPPNLKPNLPADLVLDAEQLMAFEEMGGRDAITFNRLGDNQSRLAYIQALVNKKKNGMEKSEFEFQAIYFVTYLCLTVLKDQKNKILPYYYEEDEYERLNEWLKERSVIWTGRSVGQNTNEWSNEPTLRDENDKKLNPKEEIESFFTIEQIVYHFL
ncbi:12453_t:CDS:2 [Funneliformis mosseae]|uniref:12453_t:CDS:1 n=1 Tax=Funneliformis mosseae TaxID=27381 RepID=A0A9N9G2Z9_FUNMO|nr:12453_t:CDS:2 [Funneliformis mosseae]